VLSRRPVGGWILHSWSRRWPGAHIRGFDQGYSEFLDKVDSDVVSRDVQKTMSHYFDRYLNSRMRKGEWERYSKRYVDHCSSIEMVITDFGKGTGVALDRGQDGLAD